MNTRKKQPGVLTSMPARGERRRAGAEGRTMDWVRSTGRGKKIHTQVYNYEFVSTTF